MTVGEQRVCDRQQQQLRYDGDSSPPASAANQCDATDEDAATDDRKPRRGAVTARNRLIVAAQTQNHHHDCRDDAECRLGCHQHARTANRGGYRHVNVVAAKLVARKVLVIGHDVKGIAPGRTRRDGVYRSRAIRRLSRKPHILGAVRAMLIVNPFATSTTPAGRDALVNTLNSRFELTVEHTTHRGHAGELAERARAEAYDVVIVHGGDGSVNEVVNGVLGSPTDSVVATDLPAIGIIPGGSANVFARALGIAADPLRATGQLIELLAADKRRAVNLGHTDDRWFIFNCGMGIDAIVIREMERKRNAGKAVTPARYLRTTIATFISHRADAARFDVEVVEHGSASSQLIPDVAFGFVSNASPWTYLGGREIRTNPTTDFDNGLGIFAATSMGVLRNLPLSYRLLANSDPRARHLFRRDNVARVAFTAAQPLDVQMDGDYIGTRSELNFGYREDALQVVAP